MIRGWMRYAGARIAQKKEEQAEKDHSIVIAS
jgi:hypothetical protein